LEIRCRRRQGRFLSGADRAAQTHDQIQDSDVPPNPSGRKLVLHDKALLHSGIAGLPSRLLSLSHPQFTAALAVAEVATWNAVAGLSPKRSRLARPLVKALPFQGWPTVLVLSGKIRSNS